VPLLKKRRVRRTWSRLRQAFSAVAVCLLGAQAEAYATELCADASGIRTLVSFMTTYLIQYTHFGVGLLRTPLLRQ
jgi:hypothetical protein